MYIILHQWRKYGSERGGELITEGNKSFIHATLGGPIKQYPIQLDLSGSTLVVLCGECSRITNFILQAGCTLLHITQLVPGRRTETVWQTPYVCVFFYFHRQRSRISQDVTIQTDAYMHSQNSLLYRSSLLPITVIYIMFRNSST